MKKAILIVTAAILIPLLVLAVENRPTNLEDQDKYIVEADKLLDDWYGRTEFIEDADQKVQAVLKVNPNHSQAHVALARIYLYSGYISGYEFTPEARKKARQEVDLAIQLSPENYKAQLLSGWLLTNQGFLREADQLYQGLESKLKDEPDLYTQWGETMFILERYAENKPTSQKGMLLAEKGKALAEKANNPTKIVNACNVLIRIYKNDRVLDGLDRCYKQLIQIKPDIAWHYGNYALFLLKYRGDVDGAIANARQAIEIMPYRNANQILALSLLAKWAALQDSNPADAQLALNEFQNLGVDPSLAVGELFSQVGNNPPIQKLFEAFLSQGLNVDASFDDNETVFIETLRIHSNSGTKWLLEHGANVNQASKVDQRTALHFAMEYNDKELLGILLPFKPNPNLLASGNQSPFHFAVMNNNLDAAKLLKELGADIEARNSNGEDAVRMAVLQDNKEMLTYLIENKVDVNAQTTIGETPLMMAAKRGNKEIVDILVAAGANTRLKTLNDLTAMSYAKDDELRNYLTSVDSKAK